jgi:hypothetical protein
LYKPSEGHLRLTRRILAVTRRREVISCWEVLPSKWVRGVSISYSSYIHLHFSASVAITIYSILAIEFIYRFSSNRPFRNSLTNLDGISTETSTLNLEKDASISRRERLKSLDIHLRLMILGLGISTLFLFIRYIPF